MPPQPSRHARPRVDMSLLPPAQPAATPLQGHLCRPDPSRAPPKQHHHRVPPPAPSRLSAHIRLCCRHVPGGGQPEGAQGLHHHELEPAPAVRLGRLDHIRHHGRCRELDVKEDWLTRCSAKFMSWVTQNAPSRTSSAAARTIAPSRSRKCSAWARWLLAQTCSSSPDGL